MKRHAVHHAGDTVDWLIEGGCGTPNTEIGLWPAPLWRRLSSLLLTLERRKGLFAAGLAAAVMAESLSFLFASSWYTNELYVSRFTGLSQDPFRIGAVPIPYPEHRLRLLGPVIAWALGLHGIAGTLVPIAASFPLLALVYGFIRRRTSVPMALVSTLLLSTTHLTMTSRTLLGYHDSLVYLCCMGMLVATHPVLRGALLFLALYGDIRAVIVCPLLLVWPASDKDGMPERAVVTERALVCLLAAVVWFVSARWLLHTLDYEQASAGRLALYLDGAFLERIDSDRLHLSVFMTFKAAWIFALAAVWELGRRRALWGAYLLILSIGIALSSLLVYDVSRALGFFFPIILLGLVEVWRRSPQASLIAVGVCLFTNMISPFYHGFSFGLWEISYPLPLELIRRILDRVT